MKKILFPFVLTILIITAIVANHSYASSLNETASATTANLAAAANNSDAADPSVKTSSGNSSEFEKKPQSEELTLSEADKNISLAAEQNKTAFIFFHDGPEMASSEHATKFKEIMKDRSDKSISIFVDRKNPEEEKLIKKFQIEKVPMPLILALAPNEAITGGFPAFMVSEKLIDECFAGITEQTVIGLLQKGKLVLLMIYNDSTPDKEAIVAGVSELKNDQNVGSITETVSLDPKSEAEKSFLNKLKLNADEKDFQTVMLIPPGSVVGTFKGKVSAAQLMSALQAATQRGCGPSCGF